METHSSILAWRLPMERGAWWLQSVGTQRVGHGWATKHIKCMCIYLIPIWHRVSTVCSVAKPCLTVCTPMDCSLPDSSIPGIFQANGVGCHLLLQCITGIGYMYHWHSICINNTYSNTEFPSGPMAKNLPVMWGTQIRSLLWEDSTCLRATKPVCHNYWSLHTYSLCSTREATKRSPHTIMKSNPYLPKLEKALTKQQKPITVKINTLQILKKLLSFLFSKFTSNVLLFYFLVAMA